MKIVHLLCVFAVLAFAHGERKNWALLVAGSNGYDNYRHQADVCHAYQILHAQGIPDENIVVMMYDDIAYNSLNPYPGNIINQPGGDNVYPGVLKDYTGSDLTADVFLAVLQGDSDTVEQLLGRSGKVIDSGPDDYVFVYFADHGATGLICMPYTDIYADDLVDALKDMNSQSKFAKLVFYLEACESGSMFDGLLPDNINVFATTASNPYQSSYGDYCYTDRNTCLGDVYSTNWMSNADRNDMSTETLEDQYEIVQATTETSEVMQYGDMSFNSLPVGDFVGVDGAKNAKRTSVKAKSTQEITSSAMDVEDIPIFTYQQLMASSKAESHGAEITARLETEHMLRFQTGMIMADIASLALAGQDTTSVMETKAKIQEWGCYKQTSKSLFEKCPSLAPHQNSYIRKSLNVLVNLCNESSQDAVMEAINSVIANYSVCQ